jgi:hypothetical protein
MVQERMPQTIVALDLNSDGTLKAAEQGENLTRRARRPSDHDRRPPLVWYAREREGVELLRPVAAPRVLRAVADQGPDAAGARHVDPPLRHGRPGRSSAARATPQQIAEAQRIAPRYRAASTPASACRPGSPLELDRHDRQRAGRARRSSTTSTGR